MSTQEPETRFGQLGNSELNARGTGVFRRIVAATNEVEPPRNFVDRLRIGAELYQATRNIGQPPLGGGTPPEAVFDQPKFLEARKMLRVSNYLQFKELYAQDLFRLRRFLRRETKSTARKILKLRRKIVSKLVKVTEDSVKLNRLAHDIAVMISIRHGIPVPTTVEMANAWIDIPKDGTREADPFAFAPADYPDTRSDIQKILSTIDQTNLSVKYRRFLDNERMIEAAERRSVRAAAAFAGGGPLPWPRLSQGWIWPEYSPFVESCALDRLKFHTGFSTFDEMREDAYRRQPALIVLPVVSKHSFELADIVRISDKSRRAAALIEKLLELKEILDRANQDFHDDFFGSNTEVPWIKYHVLLERTGNTLLNGAEDPLKIILDEAIDDICQNFIQSFQHSLEVLLVGCLALLFLPVAFEVEIPAAISLLASVTAITSAAVPVYLAIEHSADNNRQLLFDEIDPLLKVVEAGQSVEAAYLLLVITLLFEVGPVASILKPLASAARRVGRASMVAAQITQAEVRGAYAITGNGSVHLAEQAITGEGVSATRRSATGTPRIADRTTIGERGTSASATGTAPVEVRFEEHAVTGIGSPRFETTQTGFADIGPRALEATLIPSTGGTAKVDSDTLGSVSDRERLVDEQAPSERATHNPIAEPELTSATHLGEGSATTAPSLPATGAPGVAPTKYADANAVAAPAQAETAPSVTSSPVPGALQKGDTLSLPPRNDEPVAAASPTTTIPQEPSTPIAVAPRLVTGGPISPVRPALTKASAAKWQAVYDVLSANPAKFGGVDILTQKVLAEIVTEFSKLQVEPGTISSLINMLANSSADAVVMHQIANLGEFMVMRFLQGSRIVRSFRVIPPRSGQVSPDFAAAVEGYGERYLEANTKTRASAPAPGGKSQRVNDGSVHASLVLPKNIRSGQVAKAIRDKIKHGQINTERPGAIIIIVQGDTPASALLTPRQRSGIIELMRQSPFIDGVYISYRQGTSGNVHFIANPAAGSTPLDLLELGRH